MVVAGFGGGTRNASAAIATEAGLVGVCAEERLARVRGGRVTGDAAFADAALKLLLERSHYSSGDVTRQVVATIRDGAPCRAGAEPIDHHFAHACAAYLTSPFAAAAIVICDHEAPGISVWQGEGAAVSAVDWPWTGPSLADVFSRIAAAFGFQSETATQRFEAMARLQPAARDARVAGLITLGADGLQVDPALESRLAGWLPSMTPGRPEVATLAAALQAHLGDVLVAFLEQVRTRTGATRVCLGGSLFYHSAMNTRVRQAGTFEEVFIPIDPGNSGLAVGAALHGSGAAPALASPFLGPAYTPDEMKQVLDNCKLRYTWESDGSALDIAVEALRHGRLVGWFDGAMEWGPRALGARCILANPASPYVLDNLNRFLKQREPWRGYALSGLAEDVARYFDGPRDAPFMECDYLPRDGEPFRHLLPSPGAAVRIHAVSQAGAPRFRRLIERFRDVTGLPFLVNTSFNGLHEPIVCSPRDGVRVFYGTGLDVLVMSQFVLTK